MSSNGPLLANHTSLFSLLTMDNCFPKIIDIFSFLIITHDSKHWTDLTSCFFWNLFSTKISLSSLNNYSYFFFSPPFSYLLLLPISYFWILCSLKSFDFSSLFQLFFSVGMILKIVTIYIIKITTFFGGLILWQVLH